MTKSDYTNPQTKHEEFRCTRFMYGSGGAHSRAVFLCAVGGSVSKPMLKGADTWERPWDVYTTRKEPGGPTATGECQNDVCSSLSSLCLSLWVGEKNVSFPLLITARERRGCQMDDSAE